MKHLNEKLRDENSWEMIHCADTDVGGGSWLFQRLWWWIVNRMMCVIFPLSWLCCFKVFGLNLRQHFIHYISLGCDISFEFFHVNFVVLLISFLMLKVSIFSSFFYYFSHFLQWQQSFDTFMSYNNEKSAQVILEQCEMWLKNSSKVKTSPPKWLTLPLNFSARRNVCAYTKVSEKKRLAETFNET